MSLRSLGPRTARLTLVDCDTGREVRFTQIVGLEVVVHHDESGETAGGITVIAPWQEMLADAIVNMGDATRQPGEVDRVIGRGT